MTGEGPPRSSSRRAGRLLVVLVFLILWGLITHGTFAGSGDDPHYMMIAHSLAFDGDLDLANNYRDAALIGGGALEPESHAIRRGGALRPVHDIGMPLVFAPVVRVAYPLAEWAGDALPPRALAAARLNEGLLLRHQISLAMALAAALLARELFLLLIGVLEQPVRRAFVWSLLFAVTPPVLSHSFLFFTEIPTALVTLFVFRRLLEDERPSRGVAVLLGALTGLLVLLHVRSLGITAGLSVVAILAWWRTGQRSAVWAFGAGLVSALAVRIAATFVLWGTLVTTPHAALGPANAAGPMALEIFTRATGLLFDREFGLLAYGPAYLLALPGLVLLWRRRTPLARALLVVTAAYLLPVLLPLTNVHGWTGGWAPAARFLVPVAPLLWIAAQTYAAHATGWRRAAVLALVAIQIAMDAAVWQSPKALWNDGDGISALAWTGWLPTWTAPAALPAFSAALATTLALVYLAVRGMQPSPVTASGSSAEQK